MNRERSPVRVRRIGMSARVPRRHRVRAHRVRAVLAALVAAAALTLTAACGSPSAPGPAAPTEGSTVAADDSPAPAIGYFVSGGLKPMGDQVTVSADGRAVLTSYGKEVARCTLVDPQATSIRELAEQAKLEALGPSPKATRAPSPDLRVTGLLYGEVRVEAQRARTAAEPWPSLLTTMRGVYADLLQLSGTGPGNAANPMCR